MSIDFTCQKCEASFELEVQDFIEGTEKLVCPHCDAKAPTNLVEDFIAALTEMRAQITALSKKFGVSVTLENEELEDELDESDEDEDSDDEELDFDEDEDEESDDEDYDEDENER